MELDIERTGAAAVVTVLQTELDARAAGEFRKEMTPVIEDGVEVILDMGPVQFLDSSGLGAILSVLRKVRARNGELRICNASKPVRTLFELVRFHRIVDILNTREEAIRASQA